MIRETLFKAKRIDSGEWVEGCLLISEERYFIIPKFGVSCIEEIGNRETDNLITLYAFEVDPETACQYIGLTDSNGKKIWENDIVKTNNERVCKITWFSSPQCQGLDLIPLEFNNPAPSQNILWLKLEVVGNIFDNPELLEN